MHGLLASVALLVAALLLCPGDPAGMGGTGDPCTMETRLLDWSAVPAAPVELRAGDCLLLRFDGPYTVTAESADPAVLASLSGDDHRFQARQAGETVLTVLATPACGYPCRIPEWQLVYPIVVTP